MRRETPGTQAHPTKEYALKLPRLQRSAQQITSQRTNPSPTGDAAAPALLASDNRVCLWVHSYYCKDRSLKQR